MAEEATTTAAETEQTETAATETDVEKQAFLDRLNKESGKRKEAEKAAKETAAKVAELQRQLEERESAGLPELDQLKKRLEAAEQRAQDAENKATEFEQQVTNSRRERWIAAAATAQNFIDPDDAVRNVDPSDIESEDDAERAVKRVAKTKKHLIKDEERPLPGQVLKNGRSAATQKKEGGIDLDAEAQMVADNLKQFLANRGR